jgi:hypothetical protein
MIQRSTSAPWCTPLPFAASIVVQMLASGPISKPGGVLQERDCPGGSISSRSREAQNQDSTTRSTEARLHGPLTPQKNRTALSCAARVRCVQRVKPDKKRRLCLSPIAGNCRQTDRTCRTDTSKILCTVSFAPVTRLILPMVSIPGNGTSVALRQSL